ncbi:histidine kinase dimerization/phospho-acceptor domain-containing protein [Catenibacterium sp.]|uniref:histidine kinase dimerization/phospho-acceptor domain-containing protein n=1 Tax=Catenibacterium sp. TaxID=2049022 RepID=UPI003FD6E573
MKKLKIFPKMFLQIFSILSIIVLLIHISIYLIFPRTYLDTRKADINKTANEISHNLEGKEINEIERTIDLYSKNSDIKVFVSQENKDNEVKVTNNLNVNLNSLNNSLIIEERRITLNDGHQLYLKFISTADMLQDAKDLSLGFLPYSLSISLLLSAIVSLIYSKSIKNNIDEIKNVTDQMMQLDKNVCLVHNSDDEVGDLKKQINELYFTLLKSIDDLELKNKEILELEKLKYEFLKAASHELKTPLASLKIILENMMYNVGKYKERDVYLGQCVDIVDDLSKNISQILSIYSIDHLKNDEEDVIIKDVLKEVLNKYELLAYQKNIVINNKVGLEHLYIGRNAFSVILSNLISNAIKYNCDYGRIDIRIKENCFYIENTCQENHMELKKDASHGLGLYIVGNLLNNYQIDYQIIQTKTTYLFKMKIQ